jgi:hypothetical protein
LSPIFSAKVFHLDGHLKPVHVARRGPRRHFQPTTG